MAGTNRGITRRALLGASLGGVLGPGSMPCGAAFSQALRGGLFDNADPDLVPGSPDDQTEAFTRALIKAAEEVRPLFLRPGLYRVSELTLPPYAHLIGVPRQSRLVFGGGRFMLRAQDALTLRLDGVALDGGGLPLSDAPALLAADNVADLVLDDCEAVKSAGAGVTLRATTGRVERSRFGDNRTVGVDLADARGMAVTGNTVFDCGDTGILVAREAEGNDGTLVSGNRVSRIRADSGGTGQNGNGINLDKANGVIVSGNRVDDCAFSAIRCFSSDALTVTGNVMTDLGEMALYVEFAFEGAVVANNLIEGAVGGISFANFFEHGGRLGTCSGNVIRRISGGPPYPDGNIQPGAGIAAEADVAISGNVVEDAVWGLQLGWGPYRRDLSATGNVIRRTKIGVAVQAVDGGGAVVIANNVIADAEEGAILGMRWDEVATGELAGGADVVPGVTVEGNNVG